MNWRTWVNGLVGALINGFATVVGGATIGLPTKHIIALSAWSGAWGIFLYLKEHPTPWDGADRRGNQNGGNNATSVTTSRS